DHVWIGVDNAQLFRSAACHLQKQSALITFEWVKGHSGSEGNKGADQLASLGTQRNTTKILEHTVLLQWGLMGMKVAALSQAVAYAGVQLAQLQTIR
ncbi:hypothetical protein BC835DRAFT_1232311, partial [Cytidiella melzeri]